MPIFRLPGSFKVTMGFEAAAGLSAPALSGPVGPL